MKKVTVLMLGSVMILSQACAQTKSDVPEKVKTTFSQKFPTAKSVKWDKENDTEWEAEFKMNGKEYSANFDNNGNWKETETEIKAEDLPITVMNMLNTDFDGYQMEDEVAQVKQPDKTGFEVLLKKGDEIMELLIDDSGKLLKKENVKLEDENSENEKDGEENKQDEMNKENEMEHHMILLGYRKNFDLSNLSFSTTGKNKYFILEPGYQLVLEGKEDSERAHLEITVLDETKLIGDIETRIIEEKESVNDEIVEISRNYYAYCNETGDIFYFGEDVDIYEDGKIKEHEGAWHAFENDAKPGIIMPNDIKIGNRYYQEQAPGVAMDRAENISVSETFETPSGKFSGCLKTKEGTALNPDEQEFKLYAPNIGLIQDENLLLVKYGQISGTAGE